MSVSSTTTKNSYSANGTAHSFAYGFKIFADADLTVVVRSSTGTETTKTLNTHYIVTNAGNDSGGNILFKFNTGDASDAHYSGTDQRPANGETVVITRSLTLTQGTDYVANDAFPAESHEDALDRLTMITQQIQEEVDRSVKASVTNTFSSSEFTVSATDRANKVFSFDGSGDLSVTQELGTFKGNWAASTAYVVRDIVKDTSTNNIFIAITAHTSSGSQPLTTNTDSAKWSLIVDAASATSAQTAAASSATAAASSATAAASSESSATSSASSATSSASTASTAATAAQTAQTAAETAETNAETAETNAETAETNAASSATAASNSATAAASSASTASGHATTATTKASEAATSATNAATSASTASTQATNASNSASTATTKASEASTSATNAASSETAAASSATAASTSQTAAATSATSAASSAAAAQAAANFEVVNDTSPQLGGDLQTNGNDIDFGDNDKAVFGAGNDLQIYHDGSDSYINDTGTGNLRLAGSSQIDIISSSGEFMAKFIADGASELYHNNGKSLETTSVGVTVNGNLGIGTASPAKPLTVVGGDFSTVLLDNANASHGTQILFQANGATNSGADIQMSDAGGMKIRTLAVEPLSFHTSASAGSPSERMRLSSAGLLGLGTSAPSKLMHLSAGNDSASLRLENTANSKVWEITPANPGVANSGLSIYNVTDDAVALHVDNSNNVGINTASPTSSSGGKLLAIETTADEHTNLVFNTANTGRNGIIEGRRTGRSGSERFAQINIQNDSDNGEIRFYTAPSGSDVSERMRLTSGGNVGINTATPNEKLTIDSGAISFLGSLSTPSIGAGIFRPANNTLAFVTGSNERARFDSGSRFLVGQTSAAGIGAATDANSLELGPGYIVVNRDDTATATQLAFGKNGSVVGSVSTTGSGTTYNTTSDIRLKQDIEPLEATDKLMSMNPVSYAWKADPDGPRSMGFIAQEMQEVMPEAVSTGDDEDAMMSMDYGRITPILVSALQDAHKKIEQLEQRLAGMEAK